MGASRTFIAAVFLLLVILLAGAFLFLRPDVAPVPTAPAQTPVQTPAPTPTPALQEIEVLRISQRADLSTIDVQAAADSPTLNVFSHVYETLFIMRFDAAGRPVIENLLVESYRQINATLWEFRLKSGIKFHNGKLLTSADVKASFERGPRVGGMPRILLGPVSKVEIVDDLTFRLHLRSPFGPLLAHLAHPSTAIIPAEVAARYPDKPIDDVSLIIGTGPYRFVEFRKLEVTVLERFEEYHGKKPTVKRIEWRPVADDDTRISYLEAGNVEIVTHVPPHLAKILRDKKFQVVQMPSARVIYIGINTERIPDVRVRQALNLAVNKEAIVRGILEGAGTIMTAPIAPSVFGYVRLDPYPYDVERARRLIREAGFEGRELVMIAPQGRYLKDREIAEAVKMYIEALGLKVRLEFMEWAAYVSRVTTQKDFDLYLVGWSTATLDADYGLYSLFRTGASFNRMHYSNPVVDDLLDRARQSADPAVRASLYERAQVQIWNDAPWIFLHVEDIIVAMKPGIVGVEIHPIERWILTYAMISK
ncbi:MAG: ABC transporter substrate-binding protein [Acidilobaceae archaeon]|nr:ABC transporter substrate-binding protein [Acidilobaceae archaeon]